MQPEDSDARKSPRYSVSDIEGSLMISHDINLVNVSLDGIAFSTTKFLQIGRRYLLKIPCMDGAIRLRGEVSWCRLEGSAKTPKGDVAPKYLVGMQIEQGNEATSGAFTEFVKTYQRQVCAFGQIKVEVTMAPGTGQELTLSSLFAVRYISPEKVLMETDVRFSIGNHVGLELHLGKERHLHVAGQVVSSEKTKPEGFLVSVELAPLSPEVRERLEDAIAAIHGSCQ